MKRACRYSWILMVLLVCLFLPSCYNNSGNEDYLEINEAVISFPDLSSDSIIVATSDSLILNPLINFNGNENDLSYEWKIFGSSLEKDIITNEYPSAVVISVEKKLKYIVAEGPGAYILVFSVTDKNNDTKTFYKFNIYVETVKGLLILDELENKSNEIHVIKDRRILVNGLSAEDEGVARNLYSGSNNGKILRGAKSVYRGVYRVSYSYIINDNIYVFGDSLSLKLNPNTYKINSSSLYDFFAIAPPTLNVQAQVMPKSTRELIIIEGKLYCFDRMSIGNAKFGIDIAPLDNYYAAPFLPYIPVNGIQYATVIFDKTNHSFRPIDQFGTAILNLSDTVTKPFDLKKVNMEIKFLDNGNLNYTYAIFQDQNFNNNPYLCVGNFASVAGVNPKPIYKIDLSALPEIKQSIGYAFSTRGHVMFYATESSLYSATYRDGKSVLAFTAPEGEKITKIEIYKDAYNSVFDSKILFIATHNEKLKEGKVYMFQFNGVNGIIDNSSLKTYKGFGLIKQFLLNN